jgi:hypothetical protein
VNAIAGNKGIVEGLREFVAERRHILKTAAEETGTDPARVVQDVAPFEIAIARNTGFEIIRVKAKNATLGGIAIEIQVDIGEQKCRDVLSGDVSSKLCSSYWRAVVNRERRREQLILEGVDSGMSDGGTGTVHVSITDPPSCKFPNGDFQHVFVTIRSVQAYTSATANDDSPGWQELAPQLNTEPMQIDLFSAGQTACLLVTLGSNTALPADTYQQIRLLLVPNDGSGGSVPSTNECGNQGFNCAVLQDGSIHDSNFRARQTPA